MSDDPRSRLDAIRFPLELIPETIKGKAASSLGNPHPQTWYHVVDPRVKLVEFIFPRTISISDTTIPTQTGRFTIPSILEPSYFALDIHTAVHEYKARYRLAEVAAIYKVSIRLSRIFDLSPLLTASSAFRYADPADPKDRTYTPWQFLGYNIWSAGFLAIRYESRRHNGQCLAIFDVSSDDFISKPECIKERFEINAPFEWLPLP